MKDYFVKITINVLLFFVCINFINAQIPVSVGNHSGKFGDTVDVSINTNNITGLNILSYQFVFKFNHTILQSLGISSDETLSSAGGWTVLGNTKTDSISVGAFGANSLSGSGKLVKVKFRVIGNLGQLSPLELRSFIFNAGIPAAVSTNGSFTVSMQKIVINTQGWNILSVPLTTIDRTKNLLFPNSISGAFTYIGNYITNDTLKTGSGYWLKFSSPGSTKINGNPIFRDTIMLVSGWNLIGSLTNPVSISTIQTDPPGMITSKFYKYNNGYSIADTIHPGAGHWVKVNQAGKLILFSDP